MGTMRQLILEKTMHIREDIFSVDGDEFGTDGKIKVSASPIRASEVTKMVAAGKGLRILVGAGKLRDWMAVWVGDSDSNVGAMHDTIAGQFNLSMNDRHVPLELTRAGRLRVTTTAQGTFDNKREVEDVLDRNKEFQTIFGGQRVDMSKLHESDSYQPPEIAVGDEIKKGKFKNSKATVTGFKTDPHGQPVLKTNKGDTQLFKPRVSKLENGKVTERTEDEVGSDEISLVISAVQNMIARRKGVFPSVADLYHDVQLAGKLIPWMEKHFVPIWEKHGYPPIGQPAWGVVEAEFIAKYLSGK